MVVYYTVVKEHTRERVFSALFQKMGIDPHQTIEKDQNGRPYLAQAPTVGISMSHADNLTVYAISDAPVGVDIESPDAIRDPLKISRRFFTDGERAYVENAGDTARAACEIWTKKEALAKYFGNGLSKNLNRDTTSDEFSPNFSTKFTTIDQKTYCVTIFAPHSAEIVALTAKDLEF